MNDTEFFNLMRSAINWNVIPRQFTIIINPKNHTISIQDKTTVHTIRYESCPVVVLGENRLW